MNYHAMAEKVEEIVRNYLASGQKIGEVHLRGLEVNDIPYFGLVFQTSSDGEAYRLEPPLEEGELISLLDKLDPKGVCDDHMMWFEVTAYLVSEGKKEFASEVFWLLEKLPELSGLSHTFSIDVQRQREVIEHLEPKRAIDLARSRCEANVIVQNRTHRLGYWTEGKLEWVRLGEILDAQDLIEVWRAGQSTG